MKGLRFLDVCFYSNPINQFSDNPMTAFFNFNRLFDGNSKSVSQAKKRRKKKNRIARIEELEGREMLSVTPFEVNLDNEPSILSPIVETHNINSGLPFVPLQEANANTITHGEFEQISTQYAALNLSANMADYNIIVIEADQAALDDARWTILGTPGEEFLIVVRTTIEQNTIIIGFMPLWDGTSVTIVSLGKEKLTLDANQKPSMFHVSSDSKLALGGLTITGSSGGAPITNGCSHN